MQRKTYQYDNSNLASQDNGETLTNTRVAVRFTSDITGKLGGVYFHTNTAVTNLKIEIRTSNGERPGDLLGTVRMPAPIISKYTWNFVDLSSLNIPVNSAADYFLVLLRDSTTSVNWSLRRENTLINNRSFTSTDGINWRTSPLIIKFALSFIIMVNILVLLQQ